MIGNSQEIIQYLFNQDRDKLYEIKEHKEKRSLSQNAYAWKLITELGNVLRKSKEEVYLQMLKDYGQSEIIVVLSTVNPAGYFKYYEKFRDVIIKGNEYRLEIEEYPVIKKYKYLGITIDNKMKINKYVCNIDKKLG